MLEIFRKRKPSLPPSLSTMSEVSVNQKQTQSFFHETKSQNFVFSMSYYIFRVKWYQIQLKTNPHPSQKVKNLNQNCVPDFFGKKLPLLERIVAGVIKYNLYEEKSVHVINSRIFHRHNFAIKTVISNVVISLHCDLLHVHHRRSGKPVLGIVIFVEGFQILVHFTTGPKEKRIFGDLQTIFCNLVLCNHTVLHSPMLSKLFKTENRAKVFTIAEIEHSLPVKSQLLHQVQNSQKESQLLQASYFFLMHSSLLFVYHCLFVYLLTACSSTSELISFPPGNFMYFYHEFKSIKSKWKVPHKTMRQY